MNGQEISQAVIHAIEFRGVTKKHIYDRLNLNPRTFDKRMKDGKWTADHIEALKEIEVLNERAI